MPERELRQDRKVATVASTGRCLGNLAITLRFFYRGPTVSYISLARKYRPKTFLDLVGQDSTTVALSNAIELGREPHGLVFSGVRGVGKTTLARLYCKALNCTAGPTSHPCESCDNCRLIDEGVHEDVLEIDGASNTGVDDIRKLQETVGYVPQRSKYKVYIIDEVHMLSPSAFNALLKTLEEPPPFVVFVFATTELNKIPETVLSRCQVFRLRRLGVKEIQQRVLQILQSENIEYDEESIRIIAKEGKGSMRDALTFLDQAISFSGGKLEAEKVSLFYATSTFDEVAEFVAMLLNKDAKAILKMIEEWEMRGLNFRHTLEEAAKICRHAGIFRELGADFLGKQMLELTKGEISALSKLCQAANHLDLNRLFRTLLVASKDLDGSAFDRFIVENISLEWCLDPGFPTVDELLEQNMINEVMPKKPPIVAAKPPIVAAKPPIVAAKPPIVAAKPPIVAAKPPIVAMSTQSKQDIPVSQKHKKKITVNYKALERSMGKPMDSEKPKRGTTTTPDMSTGPSLQNRDEKSIVSTISEKPFVEPNNFVAKNVLRPDSNDLDKKFPKDWPTLVDEWKRQNPVEARTIEEAFLVTYQKDVIELEVEQESLAAAKLSKKSIREKIQKEFQNLFGFTGLFSVKMRERKEKNSNKDESILLKKKREKKENEEKLKVAIQTHPMTLKALRVFAGEIDPDSIRLND